MLRRRFALSTVLSFVCSSALAFGQEAERYVAELQPLNPEVSGQFVSGTAVFEREGDELRITVDAEGLSPGMHLQHLHGVPAGGDAACATREADANGDGIVDLRETEPSSGVTLIPLNEDPVALEIKTETYPTAGRDGTFRYEQTISFPELQEAVREKYGIEDLQLDQMVVYVHGVPEGTRLPQTVESLPDVPAQVTLPIACGALERAPQ